MKTIKWAQAPITLPSKGCRAMSIINQFCSTRPEKAGQMLSDFLFKSSVGEQH